MEKRKSQQYYEKGKCKMKKFLLVMFVCLFTFSPVFAGESSNCKSCHETPFRYRLANAMAPAMKQSFGEPRTFEEAAAAAIVAGLFIEPVTTLTITGVVVGGIVLWGVGNAVVDAVSE